MKFFLWVILCIVAGVCLWKAIERDSHLIKMGAQDLRNRVVGARLQKDGTAPYFYKWKKADGLRYYDPANFDTLSYANITATPFFHELLYPIAELRHNDIKKTWLGLHYIFWGIMLVLSISLTKKMVNRLIILCFAIAFLFTEAWINSIVAGQLYLFIPFLFFLFFYFFRNNDNIFFAFAAGTFSIALVLVRPNAAVAFIPFLFLAGRYTKAFKVCFFLPVLSIFLMIICSKKERDFWQSYYSGISHHIAFHSGKTFPPQLNESDPGFIDWEGQNMHDMQKEEIEHSYINNSENGNFFVLVKAVFNINVSPQGLLALAVIVIVMINVLFYWYFSKNRAMHIVNCALVGYCLYMTSDLLSPVHRHQYYTVQWLFPLFLAGAIFSSKYGLLYTFIFAGLIMNIVNVRAIPMEHTMGEYIWLAAFMALGFVFSDTGGIKKLKIT